MEWIKYTIRTTEEAEDLLLAELADLGIESVEIEDLAPPDPAANGGLFGDVLPDLPEDDGLASVSFYLDEKQPEDERTALLASVRERIESLREFTDVGEGTIFTSRTEEEDWINNWKQYFHAFSVDDIRIIPSWEESEEDGSDHAMLLHIDPGTAFGTGKHASTQLAIRLLRKYLKTGDAVLDVGTGSGILGIIALKSGAAYVCGTDIDPVAFPALAENVEKNGLADAPFDALQVNIITEEEGRDQVRRALRTFRNTSATEKPVPDCSEQSDTTKESGSLKEDGYDLVVANMIAEIIAELTPFVPEQLASGGIYITSGILREKEAVVRSALDRAGFEILEVLPMDEWCAVAARKK